MKSVILLILLNISFAVSVQLNENYGSLIKNVHDKYRAGGVDIILGTNHLSFERITIWHEAVRMLSHEGILTHIETFRQFEGTVKANNERPIRSLKVMVFDTIGGIYTFDSMVKNVRMSNTVWLIFFIKDASRDVCKFCVSPYGNLSNLKFGSKVLISCCDSNTIEEWYIKNNRIKRQALGRLTDNNREIRWFSDELVYGRVYSMDGQALRVAALKNSPFFRVKDGSQHHEGYAAEVLKDLSQAMNFTMSEIIWDDQTGVWNPETLNWTGVFGLIHRRETDIGSQFFFMTSERYDAVSFTSSVSVGNLYLYFRKHDPPYLLLNVYFKTFTMYVWMVIIGLILTVPILLTIIKYRRGSHFFPLLFEQYLCVWGIYCQQSLPEFPRERPSRIVYISILLSAMVISTAYSASLISNLVVPSYLPFNTMEQFVEDGTYKLIVLKSYIPYTIHKFSDEKLMKKLLSLIPPEDSLPSTYQEAFDQVCSERVAFHIHSLIEKTHLHSIPCEIISIKTGIIHLALIMQRGSRYLDLFNYHLTRFRVNGITSRIMDKYQNHLKWNQFDHPSASIQGIAAIIFFLAGFLIASIIFIIERFFYSSTKKLCNRKRQRAFLRKNQTFPFTL